LPPATPFHGPDRWLRSGISNMGACEWVLYRVYPLLAFKGS